MSAAKTILPHLRMSVWLAQALAPMATLFRHSLRAQPAEVAARPTLQETARSAQLFAQALQENSNLALDWLWYAIQMTDIPRRRYCITCALAIDPNLLLAQRALAELPPNDVPDETIAFVRREA